ncbi:NAD-dependent deacetylase [Catalinimonas alkaloidigena]|uniref:NAD-dependent protein deacylase n=1 Tax=Catalinimonas alkaloidigena TaxID=1075417 RepID=A0A1G8WP07_9BACT|nr:NAD-dependent deacylase [Catalinimonas alkaloidigena]SDJ79856.1 NAD-dependent deacetylase [Catalinimonas alkaloidigena]
MPSSSPKQKLVALTGAGISAESGLGTFRGAGGLWEGHSVMDVASPEGWRKNPTLVLEFYNQRRRAARQAQPNEGHKLLAALEQFYDVVVITQNVDDLHERAGSTHVLHLHGELFKSRSTADETLVYAMDSDELNLGDCCERGAQLRPHIVWFGEMVPMMDAAIREAVTADIFLVVGTSLQVYPAAGLVDYVDAAAPVYVIDPETPYLSYRPNLHPIPEKASTGMRKVYDLLT